MKITVKANIEENLKTDVEKTLENLGLTTAEAIRLFFVQIQLQRGLPFEVKMPKLIYNKETREIIDRALEGKDIHFVEDIDQLKKELESDC
jgi:DNA-damage-inducible protein J